VTYAPSPQTLLNSRLCANLTEPFPSLGGFTVLPPGCIHIEE
jgi:hypothetical protein